MAFKIPEGITRTIGKVKLGAMSHGPEILLVVGTIELVATAVSAAKATLKFQEVIKEHNERIAFLDELKEKRKKGTETPETKDIDISKNRIGVYWETTKSAVRIYAPTVSRACLSLTSFYSAFSIEKERFLTVSAAFTQLFRSNKLLEDNVEKEYGAEKLQELKGFSKKDIIAHVDEETGEVIEESKPLNTLSVFELYFGPDNPNWDKDMEANRKFLQYKENYANFLCKYRGYLLINEAREMLGDTQTQAGTIFGWIYNGTKEKSISFGISEIDSPPMTMNGILLKFNCDPQPIISRLPLPEM